MWSEKRRNYSRFYFCKWFWLAIERSECIFVNYLNCKLIFCLHWLNEYIRGKKWDVELSLEKDAHNIFVHDQDLFINTQDMFEHSKMRHSFTIKSNIYSRSMRVDSKPLDRDVFFYNWTFHLRLLRWIECNFWSIFEHFSSNFFNLMCVNLMFIPEKPTNIQNNSKRHEFQRVVSIFQKE